MNGDKIDYQFEVDFQNYRMTSTIVSEGLPYGGKWLIQIDPIDEHSSRLTIVEQGFVDPPFWRFMSKYIFGHESNIQDYLNDVEKHYLETHLGVRK